MDFFDDHIETAYSRFSRRVAACRRRMMMEPDSRIPVLWEAFGVAWICWDIIMIPFQSFKPDETVLTAAISWIVRWFWTLDMPLTLFIGYTAPTGLLVMSMGEVAKNYLRSRFCLDAGLVTCSWVAFSIEVASNDEEMLRNILMVLKVLQLFRTYRLYRAWKMFDHLFMQARSEERVLILNISIVGIALLVSIHVLGCAWYWVSDAEFTLPGDTMGDQYLRSVHTCLALLIGEHAVAPQNSSQRIFVVLILLFGFVLVAAMIGSFTTALSRLQELTRHRTKQFATLNRFLSENSISHTLSARINRNAQYTFSEQKMHIQEGQVSLLELVSDQLKSELRYEMHGELLRMHPFLQLFDILQRRAIQQICTSAVAIVRITRGDVVFSTLEVSHKPSMLICRSGSLRYLGMEGAVTVSDGKIVSEGSLWVQWTHCGTLKAAQDSQMMIVDAHKFGKAMRKVPLPHTKEYALKFVAYLQSCSTPSDIGPDQSSIRKMAMEVFSDHDEYFEPPLEWATRRRRSSASASDLFESAGSLFGSFASGRRTSSFGGVIPSMSMLPTNRGQRLSKTSVNTDDTLGSARRKSSDFGTRSSAPASMNR
jgi:hypothetical protein